MAGRRTGGTLFICRRLANGETLVAVARTYGVDATTIGRLQLGTLTPLAVPSPWCALSRGLRRGYRRSFGPSVGCGR
jgi:hypothetical protein